MDENAAKGLMAIAKKFRQEIIQLTILINKKELAQNGNVKTALATCANSGNYYGCMCILKKSGGA